MVSLEVALKSSSQYRPTFGWCVFPSGCPSAVRDEMGIPSMNAAKPSGMPLMSRVKSIWPRGRLERALLAMFSR